MDQELVKLRTIADKIYSVDNTRLTDSIHTEEEWKPIENWPYEVSLQGQVRRTEAGNNRQGGKKYLKWLVCGGGYPFVNLSAEGKVWPRQVHLLVAAAFLGPTPAGMEVDHKDADRWNPRLSNLCFVTPSQNILGAVDRGHRGVNRWNALFTDDDIRQIRSMRNHGSKIKEIAEIFQVSRSAIQHIILGHNWRHIS